MSDDGSLKLGALVGRLTMLEIACARCARRGRLRLDKLIARPEMSLPELRVLLAGD